MKKITLILFALFTCWQINAQSVVIGTGTTTTTSTGNDPIHGYYESFKYQVVYTAAELSASLTPYDEITALGFSIAGDYAGGDLVGYTIKMGHTSATNSAAHDNSPTVVVKNPFNYNPTVTSEGVFDMITFDNNFVWNGVDNVLIEICTDGPNAYVSPYGEVRMTTMTNGSRYYRVDGGVSCNVNTNSTNGNRPNIQFNYIEGTPPSCLAPNALTSTNITSSSATLGWTENGSATVWNIEYGVTGFVQGTGDLISGATNPQNVTGLNPNTVYQFYVQSDCGGSQSTWSGPITFRTACDPFGDFQENFDALTVTGSIPDCWSVLLSGAGLSTFATVGMSTTNYSAPNSISLYNSSSPNTSNIMLVSPIINNLSDGTNRLRFFARNSSAAQDLEIGTMSDPMDASTFTVLETVDINGTWAEYTVSFASYTGTDTYFAFRRLSTSTYTYVYVDNVIWEPIPSCVEPNTIIASNITSNSVDLSWTDGSGGLQFDYEYVIQAPATGEPTGAGAQIGDVTVVGEGFDIEGNPLTPNTSYEVYVRADCGGGDYSTWVGPITFRTACVAITALPHAESFDDSTNPSCWSTALITGTTNWAPDDSSDGVPSARTGARFAGKSWSGNDDALLISPAYDLSAYPTDQVRLNVWIYRSANGLDTDKVTFYANTQNNLTGADMLVDVPLPITAAPTVASAGWYNYTVDVPLSYNTSGIFYIIAQGRTSSSWTSYSVGFDDYVLELTPTTAPSCATNIVATPDANCGNFANSITWDATDGAEGYTINVGTTPGGTDIANAVSLTSATYSFTGTMNTTYYYTITPFNANGSATGCSEQSFTTNANGCYCVSEPTSVDGTGFTNIQVVATDFPNTVSSAPVYNDHTANVVDMFRGINNNIQITFDVTSFGSSSYDYNTVIWIDANDDYVLDASEIVFTGVSPTTAAPTLLDASFVMPASMPLGQHRMRIVATDALQNPANPCYSGTYGETADFTINVVAPSCAPPAATTSVVYDCTNSQFSIDVNVTDLGNGSPVISDGTSTWPVSATGTQNVGPFAFGTPVTLTILHGTDASCNLPLGTFNYGGCPPVNDDCENAIALTVNSDLTCGVITSATNAYATASSQVDNVTGTPNNDVWFSFVATGTSHVVSLLNVVTATGTSTDMGMGVYDATGGCTSLTFVADSDPNTLNLNGLTIGNTYLVRVYNWGSNAANTNNFNICLGTPPAPPANDDCVNAEVLTPGGVFADNAIVGTNVSATSSTETAPGCASYLGGDVWYSAVVPASGSLTFEVNSNGGITDGAGAVYSGSCGALVLLDCDDSSSATPNDQPLISVVGRTPGEVLYFRVWEYSNDSFGTFLVSAYDASLSSGSFDNANFTAYPNPVKDVLNVSYTTEISSIRVINMIGQEVLSKNVNATSSQVDMSQLSAGTYIVNVTLGDTIKTLKVVKQ